MASLIMSRVYNVATRIFTGFGLIVFCLIIVLAVMTTWKMPIHQFNLWKLGRNFQEIDPYHPLDSKLLGKVRNFGVLFSGALDYCDYFVGEVRSTMYSKENVQQMYSGLFVNTSDGAGRIPVAVRFFDAAVQGHAYVVFATQKSRPPYGDIRCH